LLPERSSEAHGDWICVQNKNARTHAPSLVLAASVSSDALAGAAIRHFGYNSCDDNQAGQSWFSIKGRTPLISLVL
jgi:hypothetical protein